MRTGEAVGTCEGHSSDSGFLSRLSPPVAREFELIRMTTTYPAGAVLFAEDEKPHGAFVLVSGRVKLSIGSPSGKVIILRIARAGEILGLHAVVSSTSFQATAETVEPCQVSFVRRDEFLRFLRDHPQASLEAARQLSTRYQETCEQLRAIGLCDSAKERLARFVLEWAKSGEMREEGLRATLTLTHEEIGQLIGTSRETITRTLGAFKAKGWVAVKGSSLLVKNIGALQQMVDGEVPSSWEREVPEVQTTARVRPYSAPKQQFQASAG
jgi:CRP/FNR family transcriptional regulator, cyclic AMP receptor protein